MSDDVTVTPPPNAAPFVVGQTVLVYPASRQSRTPVDPTERTVTKVGRKLVYVTAEYGGHADQAFYIQNGQERRSPNAGGLGDVLYTHGQWAESQRESDVNRRLREHGIAPAGYGGWKQDLDTLERLLAVLDEGVAR